MAPRVVRKSSPHHPFSEPRRSNLSNLSLILPLIRLLNVTSGPSAKVFAAVPYHVPQAAVVSRCESSGGGAARVHMPG